MFDDAVFKSLAGRETGRCLVNVDAALSMRYAAVIGDTDPCYYDDRRPSELVVHPLLAPVLTQRLAMSLPERLQAMAGIGPAAFAGVLHHDESVEYLAPVTVGSDIELRETVAGFSRKPGGALLSLGYEASVAGRPIFRTRTGLMLYDPGVPRLPKPSGAGGAFVTPPLHSAAFDVSATLPWVYEACTGVVHPVHTSWRTAAAAGFAAPVLQGTATLALAVREVLKLTPGACIAAVRALKARFRAVVLAGATVAVDIVSDEQRREGRTLGFRAVIAGGAQAISDGKIVLGEEVPL